jgi:hypothetical protein
MFAMKQDAVNEIQRIQSGGRLDPPGFALDHMPMSVAHQVPALMCPYPDPKSPSHPTLSTQP